MKLKSKAVIILLTVSIIPLLLLSFISYKIAGDILMRQIGNQVKKTAIETDEKISLYFGDLLKLCDVTAGNKDFLLWAKFYETKGAEVDFLKEIFDVNFKYFVSKNKNFTGIYFLDKSGGSKYSAINGTDSTAFAFLKNPENIEDGIKNVFNGKKENLLYITKKILFENKYFGSLVFKINAKQLDALVESIKIQGLENYNIFIAENENVISSDINKRIEKDSFYNKDLFDVDFGKLEYESFNRNVIGGEKVFLYKNRLNKFNWDAVIILRQNELLYPVSKLKIAAAIITFIVCLIMIILSVFLSDRIVKPIISLTNSAVKISSGNLEEKIQSLKTSESNGDDEIKLLAGSFETMRIKIKEHIDLLDNKVLERTKAISDLLDNAGQGFLSFDISLTVMKEYSAQCVEIFGKKIDHLNILELLYPRQWEDYLFDYASLRSDSEIVIAEDSFKYCLENEKPVMLKLLPQEIKLNNKVLSVKYVFLKHKNKSENKIMLIITDVTLEKHLAKKAEEEEERNKFIVKVALDKNSFIFFIKDASSLIAEMRNFANQNNVNQEVLNHIYRNCHTIKGNASFFNMKNIAATAHTFENFLEEIKLTSVIPDNIADILNKNIENIYLELNRHLDLVGDFLNREEILKNEKTFEISESKIDNLADYIIRKNISEPDKKYILSKINELKKISIKYILKRFALNCRQLAEKMGKKIGALNLINEDLPVDYYYLKSAIDTFVHLIRNAVDHGLEIPAERKRFNKPPECRIEIALEDKIIRGEHWFVFSVFDDGRGIDLNKLKSKIIEKKILTSEKAGSLSESELMNLVFVDGISSKESSNEISGRGVGLSAVKSAVESLNGEIKVASERGKFCRFTVLIPIRL